MKITGIGSYLPKERRSSAACDALHGLPDGRIEALTGVGHRHVAGPDEDQIMMGVAAAQDALDHAGCTARHIDLIIGASAVPYQPIPATAPGYQRGLGLADGMAFAFDVNATCLSFVTALEVAEGMLAGGTFRRALIISSEVATRALPWDTKPDVAGLFGDGAAAVVVEPSNSAILTAFETHSTGFDACGIGAGGTRFDFRAEPQAFAAHSLFDMDGKALFRLTARSFAPFVQRLLEKVGWDRADVDYLVPHQASPAALQHLVRHCGFAPEQVVDISAEMGNQIAASLPIALATIRGKLTGGSKVLMLGTSAGVSFGGAAVTFP